MSIYDVSIDEARARVWIMDVYTEINAVNNVLERISGAQKEMPGENDSIMSVIVKTGEATGNLWKTMTRAFQDSCNFVEDAIKRYGTVGSQVVESFEEQRKKLGY